jgi:hypothetical protein
LEGFAVQAVDVDLYEGRGEKRSGIRVSLVVKDGLAREDGPGNFDDFFHRGVFSGHVCCRRRREDWTVEFTQMGVSLVGNFVAIGLYLFRGS